MAELLGRAARSESVVAAVLTGANGYFTSGADIKELQTGREFRAYSCFPAEGGTQILCVRCGKRIETFHPTRLVDVV